MNVTELQETLAVAKRTLGACYAAVWMKNRRSGEWYEWSTCSLDPGHAGPHQIWSDRDSAFFWHPWNDSDSGTHEDRNYGEVFRTEWRAEPSPWTTSTVVLWNEAGPGPQ